MSRIKAEFKAEPRTERFMIKMSKSFNLNAAIEKELKKALKTTGENLKRGIVKLLISPPKTGRIYPLRGALHKASAPGEAPANRTGNLIQSLYSRVLSATDLEIGETAKYAGYLEDGTKKMLPRPHIVPTVMKNNRKIKQLIEEAISMALPE